MGIEVRLRREVPWELDAVYRSMSNHIIPTSIDVETQIAGRWPDISLFHGAIETVSNDGGNVTPREMTLRIHGVTVRALMDRLLEHPDTREYLSFNLTKQGDDK
jgi:hypothetical protein